MTRQGTCDDCRIDGPVTPVRWDYRIAPTEWGHLCADCLTAGQAVTDFDVTVTADRNGTCDECRGFGPVTSVRVDYETDPTTWADLCGPCLRASQTDMEVLSVTVLPDEQCAECGETAAGIDVQWAMATPHCGRCWELANVE